MDTSDKKSNQSQTELPNFYLPFGGKINKDNRWVILAELIPWEMIENKYAVNFSSAKGNRAFTARIALGALIIKEKLQITDRETVEQIKENPYLQFFIGYSEFQNKTPFDSSSMVHFRNRFDKKILAEINDEIALAALKQKEINKKNADDKKCDDDEQDKNDDGNAKNTPTHKGRLLVDATCTPADISYPTDLGLLNKAREKTEAIIDTLHTPFVGEDVKPRTYRIKARKEYLKVAKKKNPGAKKIRKAIKKQLGYLTRNLASIDKLVLKGGLTSLSSRQHKELLVINELYRQQLQMYSTNTRSIPNRIVSISQPHVRPIVRGKAKASVEFGAKLSASVVDGFIFGDRIEWENFNEGGDLKMQIEEYKRRFGFCPESIHADKIYSTKVNRALCKELGIRFSGVPLGRPKKVTPENSAELVAQKKQLREDEISRIPVEGKFGQGKRRFGLGLIMSKLKNTAEVSIMLSLLVMNLEKFFQPIISMLFLLFKSLHKGMLTKLIELFLCKKSQYR